MSTGAGDNRGLEYRVLCQNADGASYFVHRSAGSPEEAMQAARALGHQPRMCIPFGLSRKEEHLVIQGLRQGLTTCPRCSHSLIGLPSVRSALCPECGLGARPKNEKTPTCKACGFDLSGVTTGHKELRCPECGSTSPFVK